jgi:hypothetical protein
MRYIIIFLFLLSSCGYDEPQDERSPKTVLDVGEFKPFVQLFEGYAKLYGTDLNISNLIMKFEDIKQDNKSEGIVLGYCQLSTNEPPYIAFDTHIWKTSTNIRRILLAFHEMGHCILYRGHEEQGEFTIMTPYIMDDAEFIRNQPEYLKELFDKDKYHSWILNLLTEDECNGDMCRR